MLVICGGGRLAQKGINRNWACDQMSSVFTFCLLGHKYSGRAGSSRLLPPSQSTTSAYLRYMYRGKVISEGKVPYFLDEGDWVTILLKD